MYQYKVNKINKVIDGDTIDIEIDLGFDIAINQRVRLKGVDAPETRTKDLEEKNRGLKAKMWLEEELSREDQWMIQTYKEDKYGRILGVLYRIGDIETINDKMINEDIAVPYM